MDRIVVSGLDSGGANNQEFTLTTRSIQAIISGELLMQDNAAKVGSESSHTHTQADISITDVSGAGVLTEDLGQDGAGTLETTAGAGRSITTPDTDAGSAHQHAYANPLYSKTDLNPVTTWPGSPVSGDIMLVSPTKIKVQDDLDVEDMVVMVVVYKGSFIRP